MKFRDPERQFRQRIELQITNTLGVSRALIEEMEAFSLTTSQEPQQPQLVSIIEPQVLGGVKDEG